MSSNIRSALPCPFCGSQHITFHKSHFDVAIVCKGCGAEGPQRNYKALSIEASLLRQWNTRTPSHKPNSDGSGDE